jgi:hypothetical protein
VRLHRAPALAPDRLGIDDADLPPAHCEAYERWRASLDVRG